MNSHTFKSFLPFWGCYYSNNYYYQTFGHFSWELCLTECANVLIKQARFLVSSGIMLAQDDPEHFRIIILCFRDIIPALLEEPDAPVLVEATR